MKRSTHDRRLTLAEMLSILIFVLAIGIWFGQYRTYGQILTANGQYLSPWLNLPLLLAAAALLAAFVSFIILHLPEGYDHRSHFASKQ